MAVPLYESLKDFLLNNPIYSRPYVSTTLQQANEYTDKKFAEYTPVIPTGDLAQEIANRLAADQALAQSIANLSATVQGLSTTQLNYYTKAQINQAILEAVADAVTSEGQTRLNQDNLITAALNTHVNRVDNPHQVTAAQVGAYTRAETDLLIAAVNPGSGGTFPVASVAGKTGVVTLNSNDLTDASAAGKALLTAGTNALQRTALGLGSAATMSTGNSANTVAAGNDARIVAAVAHGSNTDNPHNTTAAQLNVYTKTESDTKDTATRNWAKNYTDTALAGISPSATFKGPFDSDAEAAAGGVQLKQAYYTSSSVLVVRVV